MTNGLLDIGDIIVLGPQHTVYADVPEHFVYQNRRGVYTLTHHEVKLDGEFAYLQGRYVVWATATDGGSSGGGMNGHDDYPSGHHVFCETLEAKRRRVDFYQTGCFTAMIPVIAPVGIAHMVWADGGR